eukprot:6119548-Amphidinium_carterae.1
MVSSGHFAFGSQGARDSRRGVLGPKTGNVPTRVFTPCIEMASSYLKTAFPALCSLASAICSIVV